jgi:hypothetical protein
MGEEKAPGRIQLVSVGMSTVGTAPGGDVFHSVPFTGVSTREADGGSLHYTTWINVRFDEYK